ncbi:MAG TPA: HD domain-containing phosphohydrolase [Pyrinomonadaceae bacterium]|nr:HD domain-containing phosphohydrolase [Pyrinomonadaceae bacterium]
MTYKIMIVDDEPANLRLLERLFRRDYHVITASSGAEALQLLNQHDVALLLTDQRMPGMTGIELLKRTASFRPHMVRIILTGYTDVSALIEAINCGQVYKYVSKPWSNDELRVTVERAVEHYKANQSRHELEEANRRLSHRLQAMTRSVVRTIADALEAKDEYVYGHARRVSGYASAIGRRMRLEVPMLEQISLAAFLHDIGKIGTPDSLLLKPSTFTDEDRALMQLHAERGARMIAGVHEMEDIAEVIRYHHEHYDGSGYPEGLSGEQIPLVSRIILVADAYDAMTNPRPFRQAFTHEEAIERLLEGAEKQFDPTVVRAFCGLTALAQIRRAIAHENWGGYLSPLPLHLELDKLGFEELVDEIVRDPALAASCLRAANATDQTAAPCVSARAACLRMGDANLRELVKRACARESMGFDFTRVQEHSVRCAVAAELLAKRTQMINADEAYSLGLLHDMGEALLCTLFPEEMENIIWLDETDSRTEREVIAFGVDHGQVGQWILESCGIQRELALTVQTHHDVMRINEPVALLLHVADVVASAADSSEIAAIDHLGSDRLAMLRLSRADLAYIHERMTEQTGEKLVAVS